MKNFTLTLTVGLIAATSPLLAGTATTPEPGTMLLMGGGLGVMILIGRKVRARKK
jgi:uncharacterized membrane protein HdeD (DUF308 family)